MYLLLFADYEGWNNKEELLYKIVLIREIAFLQTKLGLY